MTSVTEAAQFRQQIAEMKRALLREQMDRRELENRVRKLEARLGAIEPQRAGRAAA